MVGVNSLVGLFRSKCVEFVDTTSAKTTWREVLEDEEYQLELLVELLELVECPNVKAVKKMSMTQILSEKEIYNNDRLNSRQRSVQEPTQVLVTVVGDQSSPAEYVAVDLYFIYICLRVRHFVVEAARDILLEHITFRRENNWPLNLRDFAPFVDHLEQALSLDCYCILPQRTDEGQAIITVNVANMAFSDSGSPTSSRSGSSYFPRRRLSSSSNSMTSSTSSTSSQSSASSSVAGEDREISCPDEYTTESYHFIGAFILQQAIQDPSLADNGFVFMMDFSGINYRSLLSQVNMQDIKRGLSLIKSLPVKCKGLIMVNTPTLLKMALKCISSNKLKFMSRASKPTPASSRSLPSALSQVIEDGIGKGIPSCYGGLLHNSYADEWQKRCLDRLEGVR